MIYHSSKAFLNEYAHIEIIYANFIQKDLNSPPGSHFTALNRFRDNRTVSWEKKTLVRTIKQNSRCFYANFINNFSVPVFICTQNCRRTGIVYFYPRIQINNQICRCAFGFRRMSIFEWEGKWIFTTFSLFAPNKCEKSSTSNGKIAWIYL